VKKGLLVLGFSSGETVMFIVPWGAFGGVVKVNLARCLGMFQSFED